MAVLKVLNNEMSRQEIQVALDLLDRKNFRTNYLNPALVIKVVEMTIPNKPNSKLQKYKRSVLGEKLITELKG